MTKVLRVGFILLSREDSPIPSTRIAVLNMFPFLRHANIEPVIVFQPLVPSETPDVSSLGSAILAGGFDVVVFQKVHGPSVLSLINVLRNAGIKAIYCVCDLVEIRMAAAVDATVVVTEYLKGLYPLELQEKIHVVHDGIECPEYKKQGVTESRGSRLHPLKAVLVTSAALDCLPAYFPLPEWLRITIIGRYADRKDWLRRIHEARWNIMKKKSIKEKYDCARFYTNRLISTEAWNARTVYQQMCSADIGIIPIDFNSADPADTPWRVKSENRLTMKMAIGLPVIASPIPSYEPVIVQGKNGFLAKSSVEWKSYFEELRDPEFRRSVSEEARKSVLHRFSKEEQARRLIQVINDVAEF